MIRLREQGGELSRNWEGSWCVAGYGSHAASRRLLKLVRTLVLDELERRAHVYTATDSFHLMLHPRLGRCC